LKRVHSKCLEINFRPSNMEKLLEEVAIIDALRGEILARSSEFVHYKDLKTLSDKLEAYKPIPEFQAFMERFSKVTQLKTQTTNFLRNHSLKTRNTSSLEERLTMPAALEIIERAQQLKAILDPNNEFSNRVTKVMDIMDSIGRFMSGDNESKTVEAVVAFIDQLNLCGIDTGQILDLNTIKDHLEQIRHVELNVCDLQLTDSHRFALQRIEGMGFEHSKIRELLDRLDRISSWKESLLRFEQTSSRFSLEALFHDEVQELYSEDEFHELIKVSQELGLESEKFASVRQHQTNFLALKQEEMNPLLFLDKISLAKKIFSGKIICGEFTVFLREFQRELRFIINALTALNVLKSKVNFEPFGPLIKELVLKQKAPTLAQIESLLSQSEFKSIPIFQTLATEHYSLQESLKKAKHAMETDNLKEIQQYEGVLREISVANETSGQLRRCLEYFEWRKATLNALAPSAVPENILMKSKVEELLALLEDEHFDFSPNSLVAWYNERAQMFKEMYAKVKAISSFPKYENLAKLINQEKNFDSQKDVEIRVQLRQLREDIETWDTVALNSANVSKYLVVPHLLGYLCGSLRFGFRTNLMQETLSKLAMVVSAEEEAKRRLTLGQQRELIEHFDNMKVWTPFVGRLACLKDWYTKVNEISEKVIAKVSKHRVRLMSQLLKKMLSPDSDYEVKILSESLEIVVKRKEKEDTLKNRPRREKKKNQFYVGRNLDQKPARTGKELIEDVVFNDLTQPPTTFCLCNRVGYFEMIQCDFCTKWFHVDCLKFNKSSLNKIKRFGCPVCSLLRNSEFDHCIELHKQERTPFAEFMNLVEEIRQLSDLVELEDNERDIMTAYETYLGIKCASEPLMTELDSYIEKSSDINLTSEIVKQRLEAILAQLKTSLLHLMGLPFFEDLIARIALSCRKFNLWERIHQVKEKKRVDFTDLVYINGMREGIALEDSVLLQDILHTEEILDHLSKIEKAEKERLEYAEFKKVFDRHTKSMKYPTLYESKAKVLEEWPARVTNMKAKFLNNKMVSLKCYKEELAFIEKNVVFKTDYEDFVRERVKLIEKWKQETKAIKESGVYELAKLRQQQAAIEHVLSLDSELQWLTDQIIVLQMNPQNIQAIPINR
jgi:hypothetical protein